MKFPKGYYQIEKSANYQVLKNVSLLHWLSSNTFLMSFVNAGSIPEQIESFQSKRKS